MKKLIAILLLVVVLTSCSSGSAPAYVDYSEDNYQICSFGELSAHVPAGYELKDISSAPATSFSCKGSVAKYYLTFTDLEPKHKVTDSDYKDHYLETYKGMEGSWELKSYKKTKVCGYDAICGEFVRTKDGETSYYAEVIFQADGGTYNISMIDGSGSSPKYLGDFQGILSSITKR